MDQQLNSNPHCVPIPVSYDEHSDKLNHASSPSNQYLPFCNNHDVNHNCTNNWSLERPCLNSELYPYHSSSDNNLIPLRRDVGTHPFSKNHPCYHSPSVRCFDFPRESVSTSYHPLDSYSHPVAYRNKSQAEDWYANNINIDDVIQNRNDHFTLMIRNIPNKFNSSDIVRILASIIPGSYRVINFPFDKQSGRNLGYCFIKVDNNNSLYILYNSLHGKPWPDDYSCKKCYICFSDKGRRRNKYSRDSPI